MWVAEVSDPAAMAAAKALLRAASKTGLLYKRFFFHQANCHCDDTKALRKLYEKKIDRLDGYKKKILALGNTVFFLARCR